MLLKNSVHRPAYATAGGENFAVKRRSFNDSITYNNASSEDFSGFGGFNDENTQARPQTRRSAPAPKRQKTGPALPSWIWIAVAAAVAVILIAAVAIGVIFNSSAHIELTDNTYLAFTEDSQTYRIATNGVILDTVFESEPTITPSLDRSFAYVACEGENGLRLYILRDKKLEEVTMEGSAVTSVVAYAQLNPGIIYEEEGNYYVYTESMGEDLITKTVDAANFIISDDASTVVYTLPIEDSADEYKMYLYRDGTSDSTGVKNCTPIMLSANGKYIYGKAYTSSLTEKLYCITPNPNDIADCEKSPVGEGGFSGISAVNADGSEIMFYSLTESGFSTYIYEAKNDVTYEVTKNKAGYLTPATVDPNVVRYDSFKEIYVESIAIEEILLDSEGAISGHTYFIDKNYEAVSVANAIGQFSPDGKHFYYINSRDTLYQVNLADLEESDKKIYEDTVDFAVTQKGNVYMLNDDNALYFYKASTAKKNAVNKVTTAISMHDYANQLYYITEDGDVFMSEEGSKGETIKFDSVQVTSLPFFSDSGLKKTFAYFYDEESSLWSIYYTSGGKSFNLVTSECEGVAGMFLDDLLASVG